MKQPFTFLFLAFVALTLGACHCKTCYVGGPGDICKPCPTAPKPLKPPRVKKRCELPKFPQLPVKPVTTKVARKCCKIECHCTDEGFPYKVEVCEITYKSLYTDGSSKVWTEVTRNPIVYSPTTLGKKGNRSWKSKGPTKGSIVGDRTDHVNPPLQAKVQHLDTHVEGGLHEVGSQLSDAGSEFVSEAHEFKDTVHNATDRINTAGENVKHTVKANTSNVGGLPVWTPKR